MSKICHSSFVFTPISMISGTVVSLLTLNLSQLPTIRKMEVFRLPLLGAQWDSSLKLSDFVDYEPRGFGSPQYTKKATSYEVALLGAQWDSNPRHSEPQSDALTN